MEKNKKREWKQVKEKTAEDRSIRIARERSPNVKSVIDLPREWWLDGIVGG